VTVAGQDALELGVNLVLVAGHDDEPMRRPTAWYLSRREPLRHHWPDRIGVEQDPDSTEISRPGREGDS
jgi:hypothetical protein